MAELPRCVATLLDRDIQLFLHFRRWRANLILLPVHALQRGHGERAGYANIPGDGGNRLRFRKVAQTGGATQSHRHAVRQRRPRLALLPHCVQRAVVRCRACTEPCHEQLHHRGEGGRNYRQSGAKGALQEAAPLKRDSRVAYLALAWRLGRWIGWLAWKAEGFARKRAVRR